LTQKSGFAGSSQASDLRDDYDVLTDEFVSVWEVLHYLIRITESQGVGAAGEFLAKASARDDGGVDVELIPELSHLLFRVAEDNKWTKDAISFNSLVTAWPDILDASRQTPASGKQASLDFDSDE
jgi:putative DNA methylase